MEAFLSPIPNFSKPMSTISSPIYSLTDHDPKDFVFVRGNTKYLKNLDQQDLATLYKNGDKRVKSQVLITPAEPFPVVDPAPVVEIKKASKQTAPAA